MSERNKGILFILMAAFFFALMSLFVKLAGDLPSMEKAFFRNIVALFFAGFILCKNRIPVKVPKGDWIFLFLRAFCGTVGLICNFYAIDHLHIADANMLNKMSPFFAIIASYFILKEKVAPYQAVCVISAFIGTLFILRPGFDSMVTFPALIGLLGGIGAGIAYTMVRVLGGHGVKGPVIVFVFSLFSTIVTLPFLIFDFAPMSGQQFLFLILAGFAASGGQFSITAAYTHAPAKDISIFDYMQIVFSSLMGILVLQEVPVFLSILGYVIIIGSSLAMFLIRRKKEASSDQPG